jgi:hypothetical protein
MIYFKFGVLGNDGRGIIKCLSLKSSYVWLDLSDYIWENYNLDIVWDEWLV